MDNSVYIILSRQLAQFEDMAVTANNIANVNTPGFNADKLKFTQYLADTGNKNRDRDAYAETPETWRDTTQGSTQITNNPFDLAINGNGYFQIQTPLGARYTKAGNFQVNAEGTLVNVNGYPVLSNDGAAITLPQGARNVVINGAGQIMVDGNGAGQVGVVEFANEQTLTRLGNSMFSSPTPPTAAVTARVVQGAIESSNVNGVTEMTHVMEVSRSVTNTAKFIEAMYDLERKSSTTFTTVKNA